MSEAPRIRGVLVTGATSPIGERLVRELLADPGIGTVLAVGMEGVEQAGLFGGHERLVYRSVDLARPRLARELLFGVARDLGAEVVVHTAMHRSASDHGGRVHAQNVQALRTLLAVSERHPTIRRLVLRSHAEVYQVQNDLPILITEDHPLNMQPGAPQWIRDRVEADLTACARMGLGQLEIAVLRFAEVLAPGVGSQLFDYLDAPVCVRPWGYDPMLNLLSLQDSVRALGLGARAFGVQGVFNIPGWDTLPLSVCIRKWGRPSIPLPEPAISPLYRMRRRLRGSDFRYGMNRRRFHYNSGLDGTRAREELGFEPEVGVDWPSPDPRA